MRLALVLILILSATAVVAFPNEGIVYHGADNISQARHWNGTGAEAPFTTLNQDSDVYWIRSAASPIREEQIQVELRSDGSLHASVYRQSIKSSKTLTTNFGFIAARYRGFDVAYDISGNALIVYAQDTETAAYEIWNGTHFIGGGSLIANDSCRGIPRWIELEASPVSNTILMAELDTTASHCSQLWNGSAWTSTHFFVDTDLLSSVGPRMDLAFEESGQALIVFESDALGAPRYATWDGSWSASSSLNFPTDVISWVMLNSHENSDHIALTSYSPTNSTARIKIWNGTSWGPTSTIEGVAPGVQRPIDLAYVQDDIYLAYQSNTSQTKYAVCPAHCSSLPSTSTLPFAANTRFIQLASSPLHDNLILGLSDAATQQLLHFDGSWSALQSIDTNHVLNSVEELSITYDVFNDTAPPEVTNPQPAPASNISSGSSVTLSVDVHDYGVLDSVRVYVTSPSNSTLAYTMSNSSDVHFQVTINPSVEGVYRIKFFANDSRGNINDTTLSYFNYTYLGPKVSIIGPVKNSFSNGTTITLRGNATEAGSPISAGNLSWYSDIDGVLGNGENLTVSLSTGVHTITLKAIDSLLLSNNDSKLIEFFPDRDQDGLADNPDTLEGDESWVSTSGVDSLDIYVNGNSTIRGIGYIGLGNLSFVDSDFTLLEFTHNFSISEIDLSNFSIFVDAVTFTFTAPDVLTTPKTAYISDSGFDSLCVRTDGIPASLPCSGIDFSACLGASLYKGGITCSDLGDTIRFSNLTGVSIKASTPAPPESGGGGSSYPGPRYTTRSPSSTSKPSSSTESSDPKSATQDISPKSPESPPENPSPSITRKKISLWWLWALLIIGILLTAISFINREQPLKEADHRDSFFK